MGIAKKNVPLYTHVDLENFPDNEVWELLEGIPYQLAPPSVKHQDISTELLRQFANYLREKGRPCRAYTAPFGVYLPNTNGKSNFVVPDLTIVCEKIEGDKYYGIPSLVIEIISPSNNHSELQKKFKLFQKLGVREYWLIYPDTETISVFQLNEKGRFELLNCEDEERQIKVGIFEDLFIDFNLVFE